MKRNEGDKRGMGTLQWGVDGRSLGQAFSVHPQPLWTRGEEGRLAMSHRRWLIQGAKCRNGYSRMQGSVRDGETCGGHESDSEFQQDPGEAETPMTKTYLVRCLLSS